MTAVATLAPNPTLAQRLTSLESGQRLRLLVGVVLILAVVAAGVLMGSRPDWRVLYSNLADKDGGAIVAQLSQLNIPYKHAEGGTAILVPADKVHDTRLRLASQGLPKGSVVGFEVMESNRFGMTQFQERLTFQRGLEGELTRSIQALSSVQSARVHLALPNQNGFFREQQKPSASVLVSLYAGRSLDRAQLAGIIHLVASSVPELSPSAVSVVDDTGKLLSTPADGTGDARGIDAEQLQYTQNLEQSFTRRILDLLEPIVGKGNVRAQVTADVDFSQTESTSESHRPNQTPDSSAVRSQQLVETGPGGGAAAGPSGVPGAVSNQPPGNASAPINGPAQPLAAVGTPGAGAQGGAAAAGGKRESIINYEVDKTVRVVRGSTGQVRRLSAAVVLNHQVARDDKGTVSAVPLSADQIEKMTALVREAIGFNKDRGDSVNLMNAPFAIEKRDEPTLALWRQPEMQDLARSLAWPIGTVLLVALVLLGLVRPGLKALGRAQAQPEAAPPGGGLDAVVADSTERPPLLTNAPTAGEPVVATPEQLRLEGARKLARENPVAVANIVKSWIGSEAPA